MARTKYLIILVTIGVLLDDVCGGVLSPPSNELSSLNSISDQPKNTDNGIAENLIKHLSAKDNDDENTSVKYEIVNTVGQQEPIYGQQYETVTNPLESQLNKTQNYYYNQYPTLSNNVPSSLSPPILQHQESANSILNRNIPLNPYNNYGNSYTYRYNYPGLYVDTRQTKLNVQSEPLLLSNAQTFYPPLFPNYQNYLINAPQYIAPTLPLRASQSLVSGNPNSIYENVQNILPSLPSVPVTDELNNIPSGLTNLEAQIPLPANIAQKPIEPIVTKDIYFHAAPPDYDETPVPTLPPKKTYKIIFIKLPSQEPKNIALQNLYSNYAAREEKTLIYVLVKKPEEQRVIIPKTTPSQHEVIFVKYKENKLNSGNILSDGVEQKVDDSLILKQGLVNGL